MPICRNCRAEFPNVVTIKGKPHNLQRRKFCLTCSPFGKRNTRTAIRARKNGEAFCPRCQSELPLTAFYKRRDSAGYTTYCKQCLSEQTAERSNAFKQTCVDYKGGRCVCCNYDRCLWALEFHHLDPQQKDFNISITRNFDFEAVKVELAKTILVCCRCHREIHAGVRALPTGVEPA